MDLTNTARKSPVGPHAPTFHLPASNYRNQPNDIWSAELNARPPKVNLCFPILRGHSTRTKGWVEVLYFRSKAVLGLPVSTTSYSRHAVSTIQTWSTGPDNGRSLTDTDGARQFPPGLQFLSFPSYSNIPYNQIIETSYISRVTENYSTSTDSYF